MKLAQHNGNKPQHNEISTTQQKTSNKFNDISTTQQKTSHNLTKMAQHNINKTQPNGNSTTQWQTSIDTVETNSNTTKLVLCAVLWRFSCVLHCWATIRIGFGSSNRSVKKDFWSDFLK